MVCKNICRLFFFSFLSLFYFVQPAQATVLGCHHPIEIWVEEVENQCDGTVTAQFHYDNPNVCAFQIFGYCLSYCAPKVLPVGIDIFGPGGIFSTNIMFPGGIDQGQTDTFLPGGPHFSHEITIAANDEPVTWKLWHNPFLNSPRYAVADPEDAAQDCPVVPQIECMEALPGDTFRANFRVKNYNTQETCIAVGQSGDEINRFANIGNDQGQPTCFPAWPGEETFALEWDGEATRWRLDYAGYSNLAPLNGFVDIAYYNELHEVCLVDPTIDPADCPGDVYQAHVNRCENFPINPQLTCTFDNADGTVTAYYGYQNFRSEAEAIDVQNWIPGVTPAWSMGGANMVLPYDPTQPVSSLSINEQPGTFQPGKHLAVMDVTWDMAESDAMFWMLYINEFNHLSSAEAYATPGSISKQCSPIHPVACIKQTLDGNAAGYLTAKFGYANANQFPITIDSELVGGFGLDPEVPMTFLHGRHEAFTIKFNDEDEVKWAIAGSERKVSMHSARLCEANELPSCNIDGQTGLNCGGVTTETQLTASGSDPLGRAVTYSWVVNCGEPGADSASVVSGEQGELLDLSVYLPGMGNALAEGDCVVTLHVSDGFGASNCSVDITSDACALDCAGEPIVQGESANNLVDECDICLPAGDEAFNTSCADCAGVPNGAAVLDVESTCCLPGEVDQCGLCGGTDACVDCAGVPFGSSEVDECGECLLIGHDLFNLTCQDCAGEPNGESVTDQGGMCCLPSEIDECGVCFGNNDTCLECESINISQSQFDIDGYAAEIHQLSKRTTRMLRRNARMSDNPLQTRRLRRIANRLDKLAAEQYEAAWAAVWTVPSEMQSCGNTQLCVSTSNVGALGLIDHHIGELHTLMQRGVLRLRRVTGRGRLGTKLLLRARAARDAAQVMLNQVPAETSSCNGGEQVAF